MTTPPLDDQAPSQAPPAQITSHIAPHLPRGKAPMLAWWGILPALAFVAAHIILMWRTAQSRATAPEFAMSYLVGGMMGILLVAGLASWIAYRLAHRSPLAGTLTFTVVLFLGILSDVLATVRVLPANINPASGARTTFAKFGEFGFEIPEGWFQVSSDRSKTKAKLIKKSNDLSQPDGMVMVDVGKPASSNEWDIARSFAGADGQVLPQPVFLDGVRGVRVNTPSADLTRPRYVVFVIRNGQLFLIMAATSHGTDVSGDFDQIIQTWRWSPAKP